MIRAAFVTNQRKTVFYHFLARRLEELGVQIFWISVSSRWTRYLVEQGWPRERILSLPDFGKEWERPRELSPDDEARLARIDATAEVGLKNILVMDREIKERPNCDSLTWLAVASREIERLILDNDIRFGFGEPTWAPEMLTSEILRAHGGRYFMHHTVRLPSTRIALFEGVCHDSLATFNEPTDEHRAIARKAIEGLGDRGEKPYYFGRNMNPQRFRSHWFEEAFLAIRHGDENIHDHTVPGLKTRISRRLILRFRASRALAAAQFQQPPSDTTKKFVLVLLHKQPESSIDVFGAPFANQIETTRALARLLPVGWEIWIKEHGHAIGDRTVDEYEQLRRLPGARLIDPAADTFAMIRQARLVVSAASTGCLEAGVLGIPAATYGNLFWGSIALRNRFDPFSLQPRDMALLLEEGDRLRSNPDHAGIVEALAVHLAAQSVEALVSDPTSDPACIEAGNIDSIAKFTIAALSKQAPVKPVRGAAPAGS